MTLKKRSIDRKKMRLGGWSYASPGIYFVTICCQNAQCLFSNFESPHLLNEYGQIVSNAARKLNDVETGIKMIEFVVMPNHVHLAIEVLQRGANLSEVIRRFKARTARSIGGNESGTFVWQRGFHDKIVRSDEALASIKEYIKNNSASWIRNKI